jgi:4-amino-4-deoxy-L-arabinose transferase-like glycosyltransferase
LDPNDPGLWLQEGAQPPLYYIIMAGLTSWIDTSDLEEVHRVNPHAFVGNPNQLGNKNLIIHRPEREVFPWQGTVLAIYVIRLASVLLGIGTILLTASLGTLLFNPRVGLLAAALVAFNPMFIFVNAAVNNDSLAIFLAHLGLFLLVRLWREAPDPRRHWMRYAVLGLVLGLGTLTKLSLGGLFLVAGLTLAWLAWQRRQWSYLIGGGLLIIAVASLVLLPWLIRNLTLYGDLAGLNVFVQVQGTRDNPLTLDGWRGEFGTFYRSFWGLFGGVNVAAPEWFYFIYNLLTIAGTAGFLFWAWGQWRTRREGSVNERELSKKPSYDGLLLLLIWPLILLILLIRWNIISPAFQGRLLFPALGAVTVIWSVGLLALVPQSLKTKLALGIGLAALAIAVLLPWLAIRPAYAYPKPLTSVPETARFGPITFQVDDGALQLVGVDVPPGQSVTPGGDPVEFVLYWMVSQPTDRDLLSAVNILGRNNQTVGRVNRYPAGGMVPTSMWETGQIWRDVYRLFPSADAAGPAQLKIRATIYDPIQKSDLTAYGPDEKPIDLLLVGEARLEGDRKELSATNELDVTLADGIRLQGYDLNPDNPRPGDSLELTLLWQATATPSQDYTVFIHLIDSTGNQVAGADAPPVNGDYPTTFWLAGERILDKHSLLLPANLTSGKYSLAVGMYNPITGARVPLVDGTGDTIQLALVVNTSG